MDTTNIESLLETLVSQFNTQIELLAVLCGIALALVVAVSFFCGRR